MRIVIDGRMIAWTGIGRYTRRLLHALAAIDTSTEYLVLLRAADAGTWDPPGPNFSAVKADFQPHRWRAQLGLPAVLGPLGADLVHFPHFEVPVAYRGAYVVTIQDLTLLRYPARPGRSPAVVTRGVIKRAVGTQAMRWAASHARLVITPSRFVAADLMQTFGLPANRVVTVHHGVDTSDEFDRRSRPDGDSAVPVPGVPQDAPFLLYVGNMFPHKNLAVAVEAAVQMAATGARLVLTGADDPWCAQLRCAVQAGPARDLIVFTGEVTDAQLAWLYRHASLLVQPSLSEGFGFTGLEAMAQGLPVLAARSSCLPEIYGDAATYFDPHDPGDLARCATRLLHDKARRDRLGQAGSRQASRYSWRATAEATLGCYRAATADGGPPGHLGGPIGGDPVGSGDRP